jgi:tetratricopeptide (TPR) repeat protein
MISGHATICRYYPFTLTAKELNNKADNRNSEFSSKLQHRFPFLFPKTYVMTRTAFAITTLFLMTTSCKQKEKPLTKAEALDFAKKIEISIGKRDSKMLDEAIDEKAIFKKMDLESGKDSRSFQTGLSRGLKMGTKITESLTAKGTYSLIKHYEKDKIQHLLFRLYDDGSLNYHDYELTRTGGQPKVADIFIYMSGENFSETLKNLFIQFKDELGDDSNNESAGWIKKMPDIRSLITAGKHQQALDIYNSMPEKIKRGRVFQIVHVEICSGLEEEEYSKAITEYETLYPNEPNMKLLLIDGYILRKDYPKALNAVNDLDKMLDKDPLLDYHRAMCYSLMKDDAKRTEHLERLVKNIPDFQDGILELLADYLETGEFEKAKPLIDRYKTKSEFDQETLDLLMTGYPGYQKKYGGN